MSDNATGSIHASVRMSRAHTLKLIDQPNAYSSLLFAVQAVAVCVNRELMLYHSGVYDGAGPMRRLESVHAVAASRRMLCAGLVSRECA